MEHDNELLEELELRFTYRRLTDDQAHRMRLLGVVLGVAALQVVEVTPESWERDLALTRLEEVSMWANAAMRREATS